MRFVLASASPARLQTLRSAGLRPEVEVSHVDEDAVGAEHPDASPAELSGVLAEAKARAVARTHTDDVVVLGCDSVLDVDGHAFGKPGDDATVRARWAQLRGRRGTLHTGHFLVRLEGGRVLRTAQGVGSARVAFADPTDSEVETYLGTGEPQAVAGGFTLDGLGGWFVDGVEGDPHTVVGVSLPLVRRLLADVGLALTDVGWPARRAD